MTINFTDAVKFYKELQHQKDAWNWLQSQIPPETLEFFAIKYRNAPKSTEKYNNDWDGIYAAAKDAGAKFPEVVCAQWALESGWGKHTSGKNNFYGLKGSGSNVNTQEFINGQWITIKAGFIDFPDLLTCTSYLVDRWYKNFGQFKGVNRATNRNECAQLLVKEGYATDPTYANKLMQIMDRQIGPEKKTELPKPTPTPAPTPTKEFNPWSPFTYKITPHITYGELTLNQENRRFNKQYQCETALELCQFLEKARTQFGNKPLIITSGNRPPAVNKSVGGASNSEHLYSAPDVGAVDFYIEGVSVWSLQDWCDRNWPYSLGYGAPKGFVHVGIRKGKPKVRWDY